MRGGRVAFWWPETHGSLHFDVLPLSNQSVSFLGLFFMFWSGNITNFSILSWFVWDHGHRIFSVLVGKYEEIELLPVVIHRCYTFRVRIAVHGIVSTKYFEMCIMIVICFSSISLAAEDPVDEDNSRYFWLSSLFDWPDRECFILVLNRSKMLLGIS